MSAETTMPDTGDCVFCDLIKRGGYDEELSLPGSVAVFEPLNPVTRGHLLVVPFGHVRDAAEKPHVTGQVMEHAARLVSHFGYGALYEANIITSVGRAATQSVFHLHVHLVPRREGDGLTLPWTEQQQWRWLARETARYLAAISPENGLSPDAVKATAWSLSERMTSTRPERELLRSVLLSGIQVAGDGEAADLPGDQRCPIYRPVADGSRLYCTLPESHNDPEDAQRSVHVDSNGDRYRVARCQRPLVHGLPHGWCAIPEHHLPLAGEAGQ